MRVRQVPPAEEPAESAARKRQCYRRPRSKERDECATREPERAWITGGRRGGDADYRSGKREIHCVFFPAFKKMLVDEERDITKMIAKEVEATSWRLRETIRVRELAVTHRLGQMRRLFMLEEQKTWKQEADFDYIETAAEMDARRSRSNIISETFFYRNMFNPRHQHTPDEFTFEMEVDVELLRTGITLSQPAPQPQCNPSPCRLPTVDAGSEEAGTLRRSSANSNNEPGVSRVR